MNRPDPGDGPSTAFEGTEPTSFGGAGFSPLSGPQVKVETPDVPSNASPDDRLTISLVKERSPALTAQVNLDRQRWEALGYLPTGFQQLIVPDFDSPSLLTIPEWLFVEEYQPDVSYDWYLQQREVPVGEVYVDQLETPQQVNRWFTWQRLTTVGKSLLNRIWGQGDAWILRPEDQEHPLESSIVEFDLQAMGDRGMVITVAQGIGMSIPYDLDADIYFYDNCLDYTEIASRIRAGLSPDPNQPYLLSDAEFASFFGILDRRESWSNRQDLINKIAALSQTGSVQN